MRPLRRYTALAFFISRRPALPCPDRRPVSQVDLAYIVKERVHFAPGGQAGVQEWLAAVLSDSAFIASAGRA